MVLKVRNCDSQTKIAFSYDASDPANVQKTADDNPSGFIYAPAPGKLRIWKRDGPSSRNAASTPAGDYIQPNVQYSPSDLGLDASGSVMLYLEAVDTDSASAVTTIAVHARQDGSISSICRDQVKGTFYQPFPANDAP